jgi:hypothetical protein
MIQAAKILIILKGATAQRCNGTMGKNPLLGGISGFNKNLHRVPQRLILHHCIIA